MIAHRPPRPRGRRAALLAVLSAALLSAGAAPASKSTPPSIRIVAAADPALAALALIGEGRRRPVLLFDPRNEQVTRNAVAGLKRPVECLSRRSTPAPLAALMEQFAGRPCTTVELLAYARQIQPDARTAVAAGEADYDWLLRAAAFAGATDAALLPLSAEEETSALTGWKLDAIYLTPSALPHRAKLAASAAVVESLSDPDTLARTLLRLLGTAPQAVVIANPRDRVGRFSPSALSLLAPLVSALHGAPLVLAPGADPAAVERETLAFIDRHQLHPTHLVLVGDELALRSHAVPDPVLASGGPEARGGGLDVRVELFSEIHRNRPQDFAVGRIVAEDAAGASALLAREIHRSKKSRKKTKPVVFLANADAVFPLGETISRTTAAELENAGVPVQSYYRADVTLETVQQWLGATDMLVWEGHPRDLTLEQRGGVRAGSTPRLVVLQGCYTLDRSDPFILMEKGTTAIVATSAAIYSAPGSAFARALFDALLYEQADLGTAVRNARNYLLALAHLQRARGHEEWHKTYRAALAFALWGDPMIRPDLPPAAPALPPARWDSMERALELTIPRTTLREVSVQTYRARPVPRAMLGGLVLRENGTQRLKELYFTVRPAANALHSACAPHPGWDVVSLFAPRTATLSVLARPDWARLSRAPHGTFRLPLVADSTECPPATPGGPEPAAEKEAAGDQDDAARTNPVE